jgi:NAD(P)-dependent dehydrogenase (short-subunit alcohol dehydrogenase family)
VLVNNAAIVRKGSILEVSPADFDHVYRVNLRGYFTVAQAVARRTVLSRTPLGRPGEPSEIGRTCVFLAGEESSYMTGEIVAVDGGRLALNYVVPVADA